MEERFDRKYNEILKVEYSMDQCYFNINERYFRVKTFLLLWVAGLLAGFIAGLLGYGSVKIFCSYYLRVL